MKPHLLISLGIILFAHNLAVADVQDLNSPDASVRAKAIEDSVRETHKRMTQRNAAPKESLKEVASNLFPLLARGIDDKDAGVRRASLHGLAVIEGSRGPGKATKDDQDTYAPLKPSVVKEMSDTDPEMRSGAYMVYAKCFTVTPEVQDAWIKAYSGESSLDVKKYILKALLISQSYTPETLKFVIGQLSDPNCTYDVGMSILANVKPPPPEALPIFVQQFSHSDDPGRRDLLAQALKRYGNQARPYLPTLQSMLSKETDPTVKQNIQIAIGSILSTVPSVQQVPVNK